MQDICLKKKNSNITIYNQDCIEGMKKLDTRFDVIITSPPYNFNIAYNIYKDNLPQHTYYEKIREWSCVARECLADDGSLFLNIGSRPTSPILPFTVAGILTSPEGGFVLQNTFHWIKSIVIDDVCNVGHFKPINSKRFVNNCHEYIFHLTKTGYVELDRLAIGAEYKDKSNETRWGGNDKRCRGNVWFIPYPTAQSKKKHPAMFPPQLPEMCMKIHGLDRINRVLDPFTGAGNTAVACVNLEKDFVGFEIDKDYCNLARCAIEAVY